MVVGLMECEVQNEILGYVPLMDQLAQCMEIVQERRPQTIFTVGGGCDVELAPVASCFMGCPFDFCCTEV